VSAVVNANVRWSDWALRHLCPQGAQVVNPPAGREATSREGQIREPDRNRWQGSLGRQARKPSLNRLRSNRRHQRVAPAAAGLRSSHLALGAAPVAQGGKHRSASHKAHTLLAAPDAAFSQGTITLLEAAGVAMEVGLLPPSQPSCALQVRGPESL